jgi:hypothetical protein
MQRAGFKNLHQPQLKVHRRLVASHELRVTNPKARFYRNGTSIHTCPVLPVGPVVVAVKT